MIPAEHDDTNAAIESRLRADAATWGGGLDPRARVGLRQVARPVGRRPHLVAAAIAAATLIAVGSWWLRPPTAKTPPLLPRVDVAHLEAMAMQPLRSELKNLVSDGRAVVRGMWRQVPPPLRRLLGS